jgi:hypothetical protein
MHRRTFLKGAGIGATTALAGCLGGDGVETRRVGGIPPIVENRPDAVYVPSHFEAMEMVGMAESGGHRLALSYTLPHRFWTIQPDPENPTKKVSIGTEDTVHLMASVWYPDSGVYVTDASPTVEVAKDGETVVNSNSPWAMISQPMGYHFGDNVTLDGDGTYTVTVETAAPSLKRTGGLEGVGGQGSFEFEMEFSRETLRGITVNTFPDRKGQRGAVGPMEMETLPLAFAPEFDASTVDVLGTESSGNATIVAAKLGDGTRFGAGESESYLAVSPRTPHHGYVVPGMSIDARVTRSGDTVFEGELTKTLDPELDFHYGAAVDPLESGDEVTVEFVSSPQVARHEGYETAFLSMPSVSFTV